MKIIYTSVLGFPKNKGNNIPPTRLPDANGFVDLLKINLNEMNKLLIISNKGDSNEKKTAEQIENDKLYAEQIKNAYKLSGIGFKDASYIDASFEGDLKKEVLSSDMVLVEGGRSAKVLERLKNIKFDDILADFDGVVIMTNSAAKMLATKVLNTHNGASKEMEVDKGLSIRKYSVSPYFDYSIRTLFNRRARNRIKLIKEFSNSIDVYAISNKSYIMDDGSSLVIYGKCHLFEKARLRKICKDDDYRVINYNIK